MNGKTKKERKIQNRRLKLLEYVEEEIAYCARHQKLIEHEDIENGHRCYTGNHGRRWCKYFRQNE